VCERTVPIKYLNDKGKDKTGDVEDLYNLIPDSPKGTEEEKNDPEKMDQNHTIRKNLVEHLLAYSKSLSSSWSLILFDESLSG
jgi:hypothetical protein